MRLLPKALLSLAFLPLAFSPAAAPASDPPAAGVQVLGPVKAPPPESADVVVPAGRFVPMTPRSGKPVYIAANRAYRVYKLTAGSSFTGIKYDAAADAEPEAWTAPADVKGPVYVVLTRGFVGTYSLQPIKNGPTDSEPVEDGGPLSIQIVQGPRPPQPVATLTLTATPTTGPVPLTVVFSATGDPVDLGPGATVEFGDGTKGADFFPVQHTYAVAGTYSARLTTVGGKVATAVVVVQPSAEPVLTPFQTKLQAAFRTDAAPVESKAKYAAYFRQAARTAMDPTLTTAGALNADMMAAVKLLGIPAGSLTNTAKAIEAEITPLLPAAPTKPLDAATRTLYATVYARIAADLEAIK